TRSGLRSANALPSLVISAGICLRHPLVRGQLLLDFSNDESLRRRFETRVAGNSLSFLSVSRPLSRTLHLAVTNELWSPDIHPPRNFRRPISLGRGGAGKSAHH